MEHPIVLYVDDELLMRAMIERALRDEPLELRTTESPHEALVLLDQLPVAVLITDYRMPEMDGVELLEKASVISPDTVRIILTGMSDVEIMADAVNRGSIYRFFLKDWDNEDLKLTIRQALDQYRLTKENKRLERLTEQQNQELKMLNDKLEQKVAERTVELQIAREQAERANDLKSQFLANLSHELRTPLNVIEGVVSFVLESSLEAEAKENLLTVKISTQKLASLMGDLIEVARLESQEYNLEYVPFSLQGCIDAVYEHIKPQVINKNLDVHWEMEEVVFAVEGNEHFLIKTLDKLLENAIKFTDKGSIGLRVSPVEIKKDSARIRFEVYDTGIGIKREKQQEIFEGFVQGDGSSVRLHEGLGIGLTLASKYVGLMGGHLELESEEGKGSRFWFDIEFNTLQMDAL